MTLLICPGIHDPALSDRFCTVLHQRLQATDCPPTTAAIHTWALLPTQRHAPFDGVAVWAWGQAIASRQEPLLLLGFSAGVVGAIAAAQLWQAQGRAIAAVIAVDGWGVPHLGDFLLYRVSHDHFTHWSGALLGAGAASFYAAPAVAHLDLWQFPERAVGVADFWGDRPPSPTTAVDFIVQLLLRHGCSGALTALTPTVAGV